MSDGSPFATIPEALDELRAGRFIILVDDEDRENEGDLVCAAQLATPDMINFMIRQAAGKLCLTLTADTCERLHLYPQVHENTASHGTAFTVSVDAGPEFGVTSGVSAADRCRTIHRCIADDAKPSDLRRPGHISPLKAKAGGVLVRAGHTEASVDLAQLAGLKPAGLIIEILNKQGEISRLPELIELARELGLKICTIASLVEYRLQRERSVIRIESIPLQNEFGTWTLHAYESVLDSEPHVALCMGELGRAVAFTSDCKARWAVDWLGWDGYAKFWSQTVRWTLRRARRGPFEARLVSRFQGGDEDATGSLRRGEARLVIDAVDEDGEFINGLTLRGTAVAPDGQAVELDVRQTAPGRYEAGFGTDQVGVWVVNVGGGKGDQSGSQTIGLALPYPPEYATTGTDEALLAGLAAASGGEVLSAPEAVFQPRGRAARTPIDVWPVCLVLALCLFPIDVAVRRVVIDPRRLRAVWAARRPVEPELERATSRLLAHKPGWRAAPVSPLPPPAESAPETSDAAAEQPVDEAPGSVTARLRAARRERLEGGPSEVEPDRPPERVSPPALGAAPTSATLARLKRARERMRRQGGEPPDETP